MNSSTRRFASIGLYVSGLAALAALVLYVLRRQFDWPMQVALGMIVVGLAVFAILDPQRVRQSLTGRAARYGSNALILTIAFIGILVVINYLGFTYTHRWDLTTDKTNTLSPETIQALKTLPAPVEAVGFFTANTDPTQARDLLTNYKLNADGKFTFRFVNPDQNPVEAQQAKITRDGTVVLNMNGRQEQVTIMAEQDLTTGLLRLMNPGQRVVYFLTGHGERSLDDTAETGISTFKTWLGNKNYTVNTLNLLAERAIPADASVVVVAGPVKPLAQEEVDLLNAYVAKGGALVVMADPPVTTQFGDQPDPLAAYLSSSWGIDLGNDLVVDDSINPPTLAVAGSYGQHPIVTKISTIASVFPTARSVQIKGVDGVSQVTLVYTAQQAWAETSMDEIKNQQAQRTEGQDIIGNVPLAVAAEHLTTGSRVVVVGDSDFASNSAFTAYANPDLSVNIVDWAAKQDNLINITPRQSTARMVIPPTSVAMGLIFLAVVVVLPGLVLLSGITTYITRRRRG